ncbi:hydrogenase-4 component B [mine drainage metagenome]|uniref:Hydrogenase-4 component B n=1 Tax=mine drainage metagenome TaxID=410659 RepID=A0A1J5QDH3_9ZZZZ
MDPLLLLPTALGVASAWILIGLAGLLAPRSTRWVAHGLFPLGALGSVVMAGVGLAALFSPATVQQLPVGLPGLPVHLRLDALSGFFLLLLGSSSVGISMFAAGYFRSGEGTPPGLLGLQYHVFLAAMSMVMLAADAYTFMLAWEVMALSSYFLVVSQHRIPEIRSAGFVYLLLAHLGAIALFLCFGVMMVGGVHGLTFDAMRQAHLAPAWATVAFGLAVAGFGAKAGLVPLHIWLPEAHPAAPSPVSALMSGVMLKTALYGLLRVSFDLLHAPLWWWGVPLLALGLFSALFGVLFAAVQNDMKRLLAYSSIENIGIAFAAMGLALVFHGVGMSLLAALALAAMLYHALNHAFFKSLLFLATGSVLHATKQRSLGHLGGLLRRMPWVGWTALVGTLAIAGLPPLNGFIAEWLLLQAFLFSPDIPEAFFNMLIPLGAALLALTAALAAYVMVKFYGVIFLGRPREAQLEHAHDASPLERFGLVWLAAGCVLLGLLPNLVLQAIDRVNLQLLGGHLARGASWFWLVPMSAQRASYNPMIVLLVGFLVIGLTTLVTHRFYAGRTHRADPWDCGAPGLTARMQDSAEGLGQPIRRVFSPFFQTHVELPLPDDAAPRYRVVVADRFWSQLYMPLAAAALWMAQQVGRIQQGRISVYLLYSFVTLLVLLMVVAR